MSHICQDNSKIIWNNSSKLEEILRYSQDPWLSRTLNSFLKTSECLSSNLTFLLVLNSVMGWAVCSKRTLTYFKVSKTGNVLNYLNRLKCVHILFGISFLTFCFCTSRIIYGKSFCFCFPMGDVCDAVKFNRLSIRTRSQKRYLYWIAWLSFQLNRVGSTLCHGSPIDYLRGQLLLPIKNVKLVKQ